MQAIRGFAIDRKEVSIAQFARYAQATGAVTAALEAELDAERRRLMRADTERLARYMAAAAPWMARWPGLRATT